MDVNRRGVTEGRASKGAVMVMNFRENEDVFRRVAEWRNCATVNPSTLEWSV